MTFQATSKPLPFSSPTDLIAAAASASGLDPSALATAHTLIDLATQLHAGDSATALANLGTALLARAKPEVAKALALLQKAGELGAATPGCYGNAYVADHPLCGQAPLDFCSPVPTFMPPAVETEAPSASTTGVKFTDENRLLRFYSPLTGSQTLLIDSLNGTAALSQPFEFQLQLLSTDASIPLKTMLAKNVSVGIQLADGSESYINGYVDSFGFEGADGGFAFYEARVVPWFSFLSKRVNSRIYQDLSVLGIIERVFADYKLMAKYVFRTTQTYEPETFLVQYNETDLHFVSRLMEAHGLFYYFEHSAQGHCMVISDDSCHSGFCPPHAAHAVVKFNDGNRAQHEDGVTAFTARRHVHPSRVTLNTFDYKAPHGQRMVEADTISEQGDVPFLEVYDGNPAFAFKNRAHGEREARRRLEEIEWQGKLFYGSADCRGFVPGHTFRLTEHHWFDERRDGDNDFLLIEVRYEARNNFFGQGPKDVYRNTFTALRRKIPYRPRVRHTAPRMAGPQTATVVGPKGAEVHTDKLGRIKVQFHWDRHGRHDEASSCWVRVSQPLAGQGWGMIAIPRAGQEVLIDFLEGNPSRPVVTGRLFNAEQAAPYGLPEAAHMIGLKSRSTSGGGGYNEVVLHDAKGKEQVSIHAQKDMLTTVRSNQTTLVHGSDQFNHVSKGAHTTLVKKNIDVTAQTGHIHLTAATEIVLQVGASRIKMRADGTIEIRDHIINTTSATKSRKSGELNSTFESKTTASQVSLHAAQTTLGVPVSTRAPANTDAIAKINEEIREYNQRIAAEDKEQANGWADSRQPDRLPLTNTQHAAANAKDIATDLLSGEGWSGVGAVAKDALGHTGGLNGMGRDGRYGQQVSSTPEERSKALNTIGAIPRVFQKELEFVSIVGIVPLGAGGSIVVNALEPHEAAFAKNIVAYRGGVLEGAPARSFPGIDARLDGKPISLKETKGGLSSVLKHASKAETQARNAGYTDVDVYIKATNVSSANLKEFSKRGPLSEIPNQGTISNIYVLTDDGWTIIGGKK